MGSLSGVAAASTRGWVVLNQHTVTGFDAATYSTEEILRDGGSIHIRAIRPDDRDRLLSHFKGLSQQSIYHRFFGIRPQAW